MSGVKLTLTRDVPKSECHWLDRDMKCGVTVYRYSGVTYGCIGPDGTACSLDPELGPFFELPVALLYLREAGNEPRRMH